MFKKIINKPKEEHLIAGILDTSNQEIIIVNEKEGNAVIVNKAAQKRLDGWGISRFSCVAGLEGIFPGFISGYKGREQTAFDVKDVNGRTFHVNYKKVYWLNGSEAAVFIFEDVDSQRKNTKELHDLAFLDHLTQIPNRLKLKEDFAELKPEVIAGEKCGIISIIDIDNFKSVNDTYGHNIGDMMLQRLTEHLQGNPAYAGHLYRLGGDEFALLYAEEPGDQKSMRERYEKLLNGVLGSYTLSNIDIACTVSIGASFFPDDGQDLFPLLRKADIALYKSKEGGRNRVSLFEAGDDIAIDLKDLYISIQPVLDTYGNTFGYELTEGGSPTGEKANSVNLSEYNRTLDFLELKDIYSDKNYIINFTRNMLYLPLKNQFDNKFIIQVNIGEFCGEEELQNCQKLHELGFSLVLNCSNIDNLPAELLKVAAYVKLVPHKISVDAIKRLVYKNKDIVFIGSQIDSSQQHVLAQKAGCSLFQGHYFKNARPFVEKVVALEPLRANYFRLLRLTCTSGHVDFYEISKIISSDPAMSYRLLKLINSVGMGIKQAITTIPMALTYLGEENLKKWIAVVCLRGITPDKPLELIRTSLIRAKFGENLAPHLNTQGNHEDIFMMGLLSLLHVALNMHQEDLLEEITVSPDIRESYLSQTGKYSGLLAFFKDYEHSNWEGVTQFAKKNNISNNTINEAYIAAAKWYGELLKYDNADAMPPNQG